MYTLILSVALVGQCYTGHCYQPTYTPVVTVAHVTNFFDVGTADMRSAEMYKAAQDTAKELKAVREELRTLKAANGQTVQSAAEQSFADDGRTLYVSQCARCHNSASKYHADGAKTFFTNDQKPLGLNNRQAGNIEGRMKSGTMPLNGPALSDVQQAKINAYAETLIGAPGAPAESPPVAAPQPAVKPQASKSDPFGIEADEERWAKIRAANTKAQFAKIDADLAKQAADKVAAEQGAPGAGFSQEKLEKFEADLHEPDTGTFRAVPTPATTPNPNPPAKKRPPVSVKAGAK